MGIHVCSNEGPRPFPMGGNKEIAKIHWQTFKIFFLRTREPISTKLGTKNPWVMGIQVYSNEGLCPFPRGDNKEIENTLTNLKNLLLKNHRANFNQLGTKHPWMMGNHVCSNERPCPFPMGDNSENILTNFKNHLLKNQNKYKASLGDGNLTLNE